MQDSLQQYMINNGRIKRLLAGRFHSVSEKVGLSPAQSEIIIALLRVDAAKTAKDLAQALSLTPGAISQLLDSLEKLGCIVRVRDEADRRQASLSVHPDDARVLRLRAFMADVAADITGVVDKTEIEQLVAVQKRLLSALAAKNEGESV